MNTEIKYIIQAAEFKKRPAEVNIGFITHDSESEDTQIEFQFYDGTQKKPAGKKCTPRVYETKEDAEKEVKSWKKIDKESKTTREYCIIPIEVPVSEVSDGETDDDGNLSIQEEEALREKFDLVSVELSDSKKEIDALTEKLNAANIEIDKHKATQEKTGNDPIVNFVSEKTYEDYEKEENQKKNEEAPPASSVGAGRRFN